MKLFQRLWHVTSLAFVGAALASCGGGGEDGPSGGGLSSSRGGNQPATNQLDSVSIELVSPKSVQASYIQNATSQGISVQVRASGDFTQLNGRTVYAIVEDPDSLTGGVLHVSIDQHPVPGSTAPNAIVSLDGRKMDKAGHFTGEFKVHACLDPNCGTELAGSPLHIPYDITVSGLQLDRQEIAVSVPFGQIPAVQTVNVSLPDDLSSWYVHTSTSQGYATADHMLASAAETTPGHGSVTLQLQAARAGTYSELAILVANVDNAPDGRSYQITQTITVTYTVTPDPSVDYVFDPPSAYVQRSQGDTLVKPVGRTFLVNDGVEGYATAVEYLSNPPAANGHQWVNHWWDEHLQYDSTCIGSDCLPVGTYTARVRFTITKSGTSYNVYWPITMDIVAP